MNALDFLTDCVVIFLVALCFALIVSLKLSLRRTVSTSLVGVNVLTIVLVTLLVVFGAFGYLIFGESKTNILYFSKDIALYLAFLGPVGTIVLSRVLRGGIAE